MGSRTESDAPLPYAPRSRVTRALAHGLGWIVAALVAYAVWRGYQNPDLILDFAALRLC